MAESLQAFLVTGAEGALGRCVVRKFLDAGFRVVGVHLAPPPAELPEAGHLSWLKLAVSNPDAVREGVATARGKHGPIAGLVHCAGGFRFRKVEENTDAELDFLFNVNLKSAFYL